jgi:hypothetical protein
MKYPVNYEFIVPDDHRRLVYYAEANKDSVLAVETTSHKCIVLADTPEEVLAIAKSISDSHYVAAATTWHTLSVDWRMAIYKDEIILIKGGLTWQGIGLTEAPNSEGFFVCDPLTWAYVIFHKGEMFAVDGAIAVGMSPADVIMNAEGFDERNLTEPHTHIGCVTLLQLASINARLYYRTQTHNIAEVLMRNTNFLMDLINEATPETVDPEQQLIDTLEEKNED